MHGMSLRQNISSTFVDREISEMPSCCLCTLTTSDKKKLPLVSIGLSNGADPSMTRELELTLGIESSPPVLSVVGEGVRELRLRDP